MSIEKQIVMRITKTIVVGSMSKQKLEAVNYALSSIGINVGVIGIKTSSGQNEQPVGIKEIFDGALARAKEAKITHPNRMTIGIENGIVGYKGMPNITLELGIVVILTENNRQVFAISKAIKFPQKYVKIAEKRGFQKNTVGSVIAEFLGGDPADPHLTLSKGKVSRANILSDAIITIFKDLGEEV